MREGNSSVWGSSLFVWLFLCYLLLRILTLRLRRAFEVCFGCHFLARPKKWRKKGAKGSAFGIRLCARKRRGAARPLCSCLREGFKIQILRLHFEFKMQTNRAKVFAFL